MQSYYVNTKLVLSRHANNEKSFENFPQARTNVHVNVYTEQTKSMGLIYMYECSVCCEML